ncbi:UpxY family transcription antiterminator [Bacteroides fluxus]|uniref:Transcription termination/antitermination factor NusG n=2 Tax=Bacteroides fluxus TaxID=626930 RepID=F3PXI8_9BACE|nr:UpxY family transcription antiterminator [Bacteroides fluxus]EGF51569.1 transcription termination/antitermination factor NusG [Bacteroides fluxus YIT 12057]MDY3790459.1 UpxY family transcription antiterminator [Bacteroides fluxus]
MIDTQKYWFAARTRDKQEFAIRNSLEKLKVEENLDIDCYLPTRSVITQLKYRRKRSEVPVIRNLIFVRATKQTACDLSNVYGVQLFYMKDLFSHSMLVVPNKQMEDFMFVMDLNPDGVSFDNEPLVVGHKVKVVKGDFCGIEGEVATEANKTYVVIRIKGILSASVKVPKSYLKIIK